jgi:hypothetical protein
MRHHVSVRDRKMQAAAALEAEDLRYELEHPNEKLQREHPHVFLRVGHFASKTQAVDVFANGVLVSKAVAFGKVSEHNNVELGDQARIEIRVHGGTSNNLVETELSRKTFARGYGTLFLTRDGDSARETYSLISIEDPECACLCVDLDS